MHVLEADGWAEGFLDATPVGGQRRVHVDHQVALFPADGQYFVRERDLAMLWSYARALGFRKVLRKVRSRGSESTRNDAWLSVGRGRGHPSHHLR